MRTLLTITDLTRMQGGRVCVAGYLPDRTCVRPVLPAGIPETWLRVAAPGLTRWWRPVRLVRPFVAVEVDLSRQVSDPPHCEDWQIAPQYQRVPYEALAPERREDLLRSLDDGCVAAIFGTPIEKAPGWSVLAGTGTRSLGTVAPQIVTQVGFAAREDKWDFHLSFTDGAGQSYKLAVTDLAFRRYLVHLTTYEGRPAEECAAELTTVLQATRVYLRIGLARHWKRFPDRCFLQITDVYSFPDYLGGRCHADFPSLPPTTGGSK